MTEFLLLGAIAVLAAGLAGAQTLSSGGTEGEASGVRASENYIITRLDGLQFRIIGEPETYTEVRVAADGTVNLPYIGTVQLAGKTVQEARKYLFDLYDADFYVNPQIDLAVIAYAQRRVQVLGKVARQGVVLFPPEEEMTLLAAIAAAGGWSPDRLADQSRIRIKRPREDGSFEIFEKIDAREIGPKDWPLKDGDIIEVPERIW